MPTKSSSSYSKYNSGKRSSNSGYRSNTWNSNRNWSSGSNSGGSWMSSQTSYSPTKFNTICDEIQQKIGSYKTIYSQCQGSGKVTAFSPTTVNKWIKFVNNGICVYKFDNSMFSRCFGSQYNNCTPMTATRMMQRKYGAGIKAVTRGKGNCWLVAASSSITARPFSQYNWNNCK